MTIVVTNNMISVVVVVTITVATMTITIDRNYVNGSDNDHAGDYNGDGCCDDNHDIGDKNIHHRGDSHDNNKFKIFFDEIN